MAAIANISLNDGKPTPVSHVFSPARTSSDYAMWEDRSPGQYIGFWKLTAQLQRPKGDSKVASRNLKVLLKLDTPVLETLGVASNGLTAVPTVSHRPTVEVIFTFHEKAVFQDRKDLHTMLIALLQSGVALDTIQNLSVPY